MAPNLSAGDSERKPESVLLTSGSQLANTTVKLERMVKSCASSTAEINPCQAHCPSLPKARSHLRNNRDHQK